MRRRCLHWPSAEARSQGKINYLVLRRNGSSADTEKEKERERKLYIKRAREEKEREEARPIRFYRILLRIYWYCRGKHQQPGSTKESRASAFEAAADSVSGLAA